MSLSVSLRYPLLQSSISLVSVRTSRQLVDPRPLPPKGCAPNPSLSADPGQMLEMSFFFRTPYKIQKHFRTCPVLSRSAMWATLGALRDVDIIRVDRQRARAHLPRTGQQCVHDPAAWPSVSAAGSQAASSLLPLLPALPPCDSIQKTI